MPKLLVISSFPTRNNGISLYTEHYIRELQENGWTVCTVRVYFLESFVSTLRWPIIALQYGIVGPTKALIQHTPTASGPLILVFLVLWRLFGKQAVVVSHETPSTYSKHLGKGWKRLLLRPYLLYEKWIANLSARFIVHTEFHREEMESLPVVRRPEVLHLPIYRKGPLPGCMTRPQPQPQTYWLFYGQISHKKGLDLLLEAYQGLEGDNIPSLYIAGMHALGQEAYMEEMKASVLPAWRDRIEFLGYVEEDRKGALISGAKMAIFPYRWISQSVALLETCAHKVPYVASDLPFFREFHQKYGCGSLFSNGSVTELKGILQELVVGEGKIGCDFEKLFRELSIESTALRLSRILASPDGKGL